MIAATDRIASTPPGVKLCALENISERSARNFVLQCLPGRFHGFLVRKAGQVFGYVDQCPHAGLQLAKRLDEYLTPGGDFIACSWHGAIFQIQGGECVGGPYAGQELTPWPLVIEHGWIVTA